MGRVKTPSPTPSSDSNGDVGELQTRQIEDTGHTREGKLGTIVVPFEQGSELPFLQVPIFLSSDGEDNFYQCEAIL